MLFGSNDSSLSNGAWEISITKREYLICTKNKQIYYYTLCKQNLQQKKEKEKGTKHIYVSLRGHTNVDKMGRFLHKKWCPITPLITSNLVHLKVLQGQEEGQNQCGLSF